MGFIVREASEHLGINQRTWERWEQGRSKPKGFVLQSLLEKMGVIMVSQ